MEKNQESKINLSGINLYIEDPEAVIKREIKRSAYTILIVLLISIALILFGIRQIRTKSQNLAGQRELINKSLTNLNIDSAVNKNWQQVEPNVSKITNALPDPNNLLAYQSALEQAATDNGVKISINFPSKTGSTSKQKSVDHQVQIKGETAKIFNFITALENLPYYVALNRFNLNATGEDEEANATLSLTIYTNPSSASASPSPQATRSSP